MWLRLKRTIWRLEDDLRWHAAKLIWAGGFLTWTFVRPPDYPWPILLQTVRGFLAGALLLCLMQAVVAYPVRRP
ncbi:hypothetical protein [Micromonospora aurantiaca (nom. illeg.)]|uniref:hypothetical protein n=1 Tax=Micromonospora aurantiaca (nom. illeg.) TaxID=47850 RepID=UPI00340BCD76